MHEHLEVRGTVPDLDLALARDRGFAGPHGQAGRAVAVQPGPALRDPLAKPMPRVGEVPHPCDWRRWQGCLVVAGQLVEMERGEFPDQHCDQSGPYCTYQGSTNHLVVSFPRDRGGDPYRTRAVGHRYPRAVR